MSDESVRRAVMAPGDGDPHPAAPQNAPVRALVELDAAEALALLGSVDFGRIVFTQHALPAIRPVNHVIEGGEIFIRTRLEAKVTNAVAGTVTAGRRTVVAYEADQLDAANRLGWSVVVTGFAEPVTDQAVIARVEAALTPWVGMRMDTVIAIHPEIINGFRLVEAQPDHASE